MCACVRACVHACVCACVCGTLPCDVLQCSSSCSVRSGVEWSPQTNRLIGVRR